MSTILLSLSFGTAVVIILNQAQLNSCLKDRFFIKNLQMLMKPKNKQIIKCNKQLHYS